MNRIQQALEKGFDAIIAQGGPSMDANDTMRCAYRGHAGRKCFAGQLIDDEHYSPSMESYSVERTIVQNALIKSGWPEATEGSSFISAMRERLRWFMTIPPLSNGLQGRLSL